MQLRKLANLEHFNVIDLYYKSGMTVANDVKFKRVKDTASGIYRDFKYPEYIAIPFHPGADEYPYPPDAIGYTYDGLHPSDKGNMVIAGMIINEFRNLGLIQPSVR